MKKTTNGKMIDIFTGLVLGGLVGLYHPLGSYHTILVVLAGVLGVRFLKVVK